VIEPAHLARHQDDARGARDTRPLVEREGRVKAIIAEDNSRKTLHDIAKEYILPSSTVFTDDLVSYHGLEKYGFDHRRINHSQKIYVMGDVHTQTIEGFWSLIKRGIGGVYHSVSKKYLQSYLNEYSFRYNRRASGNLIFLAILQRVGEMASHTPALEGERNPGS
jgi:transposase-like protein